MTAANYEYYVIRKV